MLAEPEATDTIARSGRVHDFCGTETQERLSNWLAVLDLQVGLFLPAEQAVLADLPTWRRARRVIDVGCGDGSYLAALARTFPDKSYVGLETSADFAAAARARAPQEVIEADYFAYQPARRFDVVLMRFVLQHLDDLGAVLDHARSLLAPGGSLIVVEPDSSRFQNTPPLPRFTAMLHDYETWANARGRLRADLDDLPNQARAEGWCMTAESKPAVRTTGPFTDTPLLALYRGWASLCRQCGDGFVDVDAVERELADWAARHDAQSTIGLRVVVLEPARPDDFASGTATDQVAASTG